MVTQKAKERAKKIGRDNNPSKRKSSVSPVKKVQGNKLERNKNRVAKPQKHSVPWSNQYGSSRGTLSGSVKARTSTKGTTNGSQK